MAGEFFQNTKRLQRLIDLDTLSMLAQFKKAVSTFILPLEYKLSFVKGTTVLERLHH